MQKFLVIIAGPTAAGKTSLAIRIASEFGAEIFSADARQLYREISIGTAKPAKQELSRVTHHFISSHSVRNPVNAAAFETEAINRLTEYFRKKDVAVMAGGSGMYIRAVTHGLDDIPEPGNGVKDALNREFREKGIEYIREELKESDPSYFKSVDKDNPRRILRALEVIRTTGKPFSSFLTRAGKPREFRSIKVGLYISRDSLYKRIDERIDRMLSDGLETEARKIYKRFGKKTPDFTALNTVGYRELFDHFEGKTSLEEAVGLIRKNTRNYAKRQLTWFRKEKDITWFPPSGYDAIIAHIKGRMK